MACVFRAVLQPFLCSETLCQTQLKIALPPCCKMPSLKYNVFLPYRNYQSNAISNCTYRAHLELWLLCDCPESPLKLKQPISVHLPIIMQGWVRNNLLLKISKWNQGNFQLYEFYLIFPYSRQTPAPQNRSHKWLIHILLKATKGTKLNLWCSLLLTHTHKRRLCKASYWHEVVRQPKSY